MVIKQLNFNNNHLIFCESDGLIIGSSIERSKGYKFNVGNDGTNVGIYPLASLSGIAKLGIKEIRTFGYAYIDKPISTEDIIVGKKTFVNHNASGTANITEFTSNGDYSYISVRNSAGKTVSIGVLKGATTEDKVDYVYLAGVNGQRIAITDAGKFLVKETHDSKGAEIITAANIANYVNSNSLKN